MPIIPNTGASAVKITCDVNLTDYTATGLKAGGLYRLTAGDVRLYAGVADASLDANRLLTVAANTAELIRMANTPVLHYCAETVKETHSISSAGVADEVNSITAAAVPATDGTFTLTVGANTTAGIARDADAETIQTALEGLASVGGPPNVSVVDVGGGLGVANGSVLITYQIDLGTQNVETSANFGGLTGNAHVFAEDTAGAGITGGVYTITVNGDETAEIAFDADAAAITAALEALESVGEGNVTVTRGSGSAGTYAGTSLAFDIAGPLVVTVDDTGITGGGGLTVAPTSTAVPAVGWLTEVIDRK